MTKKELLEMAVEMGVEVRKSWTKDTITEAIQAYKDLDVMEPVVEDDILDLITVAHDEVSTVVAKEMLSTHAEKGRATCGACGEKGVSNDSIRACYEAKKGIKARPKGANRHSPNRMVKVTCKRFRCDNKETMKASDAAGWECSECKMMASV